VVLTEYEQEELDKVGEHKRRILNRSPRRLIPETVQERSNDLLKKAMRFPGAEKVKDSGAAALNGAAVGAGKFMTRTGQLTTSSDRVVRAYVKKGHAVQGLDDIKKLDLKQVDKVAAFTRLRYTYSVTAAVEGAATGLAVSGGQAAAAGGGVAGAGVGAAPGLGAIAAAAGADIAALLTACSRVVAHQALYYGYDPLNTAEDVFMMQVIGLGLATTGPAKAVAYQQLAVLTRSLARNLVWRDLNQQTFVKVAQKFAAQFGQKLTKRKLGQFVPIAGVGIGAALNYKMVDDVAEAAYWAYRERFLLDKGGANTGPIVIDAEFIDENESPSDDETAINIVDILESEGIRIDDDPDPTTGGS
jgi:hypothetical protein